MPMRGAVTIVGSAHPGSRPSTSIGPSPSETPFRSSPIASASVNFPGPEHRSSSRSMPRRARMVSMPATGSSARISTAAASPSGSATKFSRLWMP